MKFSVLILFLLLTLISNLSFTQTDSLFGKEVTVHLHKTKKTFTGEYRSYKNNRVTVLFDNSLHDYFYPEVELLKFEEFNLRFDDKGEVFVDRIDLVKEQSNYLESILISQNDMNAEKKLILYSAYYSKEHVIDMNKVVKIKLKNGIRLKSKWISIINDSTLLFQNYHEIAINRITSIKYFSVQPKNVKTLGNLMTIAGYVSIPFGPVAWIVGAPMLVTSKYVKGYRSKKINGLWELKVE
jgi:hypothetical protein